MRKILIFLIILLIATLIYIGILYINKDNTVDDNYITYKNNTANDKYITEKEALEIVKSKYSDVDNLEFNCIHEENEEYVNINGKVVFGNVWKIEVLKKMPNSAIKPYTSEIYYLDYYTNEILGFSMLQNL